MVNRRGTTVAVPSADISRSLIAPKAGTKITAMWIQITIVLVGAAIFATASLADSASMVARKAEVLLAGAPDRGIFDPSIKGDGRQLYMTVSGVSSTAAGNSLGVIAVQSYLARSQDQGRTWQLVGGVVNPDDRQRTGATGDNEVLVLPRRQRGFHLACTLFDRAQAFFTDGHVHGRITSRADLRRKRRGADAAV